MSALMNAASHNLAQPDLRLDPDLLFMGDEVGVSRMLEVVTDIDLMRPPLIRVQ